MNCPYCNKDLGSGLTTALSHDCCAKKPLALQFKEGKPIGYVYFASILNKNFKIISSSYMNTTIIYIMKYSNGIVLDNKVFTKVKSFIHPNLIDKKLSWCSREMPLMQSINDPR